MIGSPQPIVAVAGDDVIIPCHLQPPTDATGETVEWSRPDLNPRFVHLQRGGRELVDQKNSQYEGRTALLKEALMDGDVSLIISNVKFSDEGEYRCFVPSLGMESVLQLVVSKYAYADIDRAFLLFL